MTEKALDAGTATIRAAIDRWFHAGLRAVDPYGATLAAMRVTDSSIFIGEDELPLVPKARVIGIAVGKAASPMARALEDALGSRLSRGIVLTKDGHLAGAPDGWMHFEASHPVPDERGVQASDEILAAVSGLRPQDLAVVLVSGGGSALFESPRPPLMLEDIQTVTSLLLRAGAPIQHLNAVRSELSLTKGGGMRRAIGDGRCATLILSDVLGNDPTVIASGPTIPRSADPATALQILEGYGLLEQVPPRIIEVLSAQPQLSAPLVPDDEVFRIVGDNRMLIEAVAQAARSEGYSVEITHSDAQGEARDLATNFLGTVSAQPRQIDVMIGGGEATVTVSGSGTGGRNTEFALQAAMTLAHASERLVVASLASDGQDGSVDAAGAIVDRLTVERGRRLGLSAEEFLDNNDSGGYFAALGELFETGPTGTNVNDLYVAVRVGHSDCQ